MAQQWEYQIESWATVHGEDTLLKVLNTLGTSGWELVAMIETGDQAHAQYRMICKRLVEIEG